MNIKVKDWMQSVYTEVLKPLYTDILKPMPSWMKIGILVLIILSVIIPVIKKAGEPATKK